ncbi:MAG: xanthine dehydrogenase, partial [Ignavibacteria bacterium]
IGGQEHLYLETQAALAIPAEDGGIKIYSSTQGPTAVQRATAKVLGLPMNKVEVDVLRLGGGFGGKEDQATPFAAMAALAAVKLNGPVKLVLSRHDDLFITGKRHPYSADYKIGLNNEGKIIAYEAMFYQNAGACADLSTAVLERTLFHATNSYFIPNVKTTGISCKTNLPPNTAFRGFGGPQGKFVIESAIYKAANEMGIPANEIQKKNLLKENDFFYYGQKAERVNSIKCWEKAEELYSFQQKLEEVEAFNKKNKIMKKGISLMPICFGISFTSSFLNQASALVHIYTDGSIGISTAAVEMGQGVNEKMRNIASRTFSVNIDKIKIESTNTTRVANTSPTAASSAADMNGNALLIACNQIKERLVNFIRDKFELTSTDNIEVKEEKVLVNGAEIKDYSWNKLIWDAYFSRISLSQQAYYATPKIYFDRDKNQGKPFAYHVYGTAITTVTVDCLRGTYTIDSVEVVHDFGKSLNPIIDKGQAEGAIVQGIGWLTIEELSQNEKGQLLSNSLSTYKIPDIYSAPNEIKVEFLEDSENPFGPFNSKAIGEPPFMYGIGAYFAILNAMKEFSPIEPLFSAPLTHEKVLMNLYKKKINSPTKMISN